MDKQKRQVNWGKEVLNVLRIVGKVLLRILSYFINIFLTVLLLIATAFFAAVASAMFLIAARSRHR